MNKTLLCTALVAAAAATALAPTAQAASSGTISFTGTVLADTCVIKINNSASNVVALPTVMTAAFGAAAGNVAGATNFTVDLSNCDTNTKNADMAFTGPTIDASGNLNNTTTAGGSNVQIQLLNSTSAVINTSTQANAPVIAVSGGTGTTTLTAQYVSTATTTTAGLVTSSVGFTMTYM